MLQRLDGKLRTKLTVRKEHLKEMKVYANPLIAFMIIYKVLDLEPVLTARYLAIATQYMYSSIYNKSSIYCSSSLHLQIVQSESSVYST